MASTALGFGDVILQAAKINFSARVLEIGKFAVSVDVDRDSLEESASAPCTEHPLGVGVDVVAANAEQLPSSDAPQQHAVER